MNTPAIEVGIMSAKSIQFQLNGRFRQASGEETENVGGTATVSGPSSFVLRSGDKRQIFTDAVLLEPVNGNEADFELHHVVIGLQFHWEREETQRFKGKLKICVDNGMLTAVNILPPEDYLLSVISSEMSAGSSLELLKAHAVISRSWLLAQTEKRKKLEKGGKYQTFIPDGEGYIRWYDREDHDRFDVCADDHCQRYQGIAKASSKQVYEALRKTSGEVLTYGGAICDARFYKCCGGVTEKFENVWEPVNHPYLTKIIDNPVAPGGYDTDLTKEENARKWILSSPPAFCNTHDRKVLSQVLNGYDCETRDFYRWQAVLAQKELKDLLLRKIGLDAGEILDLIPVERGVSGRLIRLKIAGTKQSLVIGKELEIRKALSESHLYSSAFVVEKVQNRDAIPEQFILKGAGWGHGVGLCQIGAAIMGGKGYAYREILAHYFPHAEVKKIY
ncbi:MAG: SpoIID/LytB domain-containing protein [Dysgonamonadaceae bacterium]|jgi:SpoIID/LytB domain protein|nr:SpoIID/LytB domain-containing protein [Dysgonamonadaceae bacterium]